MNSIVNPRRPGRSRLLTTLAQQETERGLRVWLRLFLTMALAASLVWFTAHPFGDTVPPIYRIGFRSGWIIASLLMPVLAILYGLTTSYHSAGRHWFIAGILMLTGTAPVNLSRHFLHPLTAGHWTLTGSQIVIVILGAFLALAMQVALLAVIRSVVALMGIAPAWGARRLLRRRDHSPSAS